MASFEIDAQCPELQTAGTAPECGPAKARSHSREQLFRPERFGEVVVGAKLQRADLVRRVLTRAQHEHRHRVRILADGPEHVEAMGARQHQIEHDEVARGEVVRDRLISSLHPDDGEAGVLQAGRHLLPEPLVVFHQEHCLHATSMMR